MANFNSKKKTNEMNEMLNHEGSVVHRLDPLEELFSKVLGSFFGESTFYEKRDIHSEYERIMDLIDLIDNKDKEYALKIAELGRLSNMIDYPLQILSASYNHDAFKGEAFLDEEGRNKLGYYTDVIVRRAKDVNRILATHFEYYEGKRPIPSQMKKQLRKKLEQFDQYKLSKGLDLTKPKSLRDSIKLLRPRPKDEEMAEFYRAIIENKVKRGNNKVEVETALVHQGQKKDLSLDELKQSVYDTNLQALLRHVSKLYKHGVFEDEKVLEVAVNKIRNKDAVLAAKLLPFRFYTAYQSLSRLGNTLPVVQLREAIEDAIEYSLENVEEISGSTVFLIDRSFSMRTTKISKNSTVTAEDIALLLGAIAYKKGFGDLFIFSNHCERISISRRTPVLEIVDKMKSVKGMNSGTNLRRALETIKDFATENNLSYDNLIILSDNDCYGYDRDSNTLTFGEWVNFSWQRSGSKRPESADKHVNKMIGQGIVKKVWINNLAGNNFAIVNTKSNTKNLVTGFSEKFLNAIEVYNQIGSGHDIRKVIDSLLEKERENVRKARQRKRK